MRKILYCGILCLIAACQPAESAPAVESAPVKETLPSTPSPVLPTQTISPAFTATPVPFYFRDEFNNSDPAAWVSFQTGGQSAPQIKTENGLLRLDFSTPDTWFSLIHNAHEYESVLIKAKVYANAAGSVGLICMYGVDGWLEYNISGGEYTVLYGQMLGDGIAQYLPVENDSSEYLNPKKLDDEMGLACDGEFVYLYVNEKLFRKIDISRFGLTSGKVGLSFASYDEIPMTATVDWFDVSQP